MNETERVVSTSVAATVAELKQVSPILYRELRSTIKKSADATLALARGSYPSNPTGTIRDGKPTWSAGGRMGYSIPTLKKGVVAVLGGSYDSRTNIQRVLTIRQNDVAGAVYDMAGKSNKFTDKTKKDRLGRRRVKGQGAAFVGALAGKPSRVMYPAVDSKRASMEADIKDAAVLMYRKINPRLADVKIKI